MLNSDLESNNNNKKVDYDSSISTLNENITETKYKEEVTYSFSEDDEKKLVKKLDYRIMPLLCLFYFADFLDRANIGNAT